MLDGMTMWEAIANFSIVINVGYVSYVHEK